MKVILVQAEIEAAIITAVRAQIDVKEGQEISIDLKQTRGESGITAEIDFVPTGSVKEQPASQPKADPKIKTETNTPKVETASSGAGEGSGPGDQVDASAAEKPAGDKPQSLFGNLVKPTNPKAETPAE